MDIGKKISQMSKQTKRNGADRRWVRDHSFSQLNDILFRFIRVFSLSRFLLLQIIYSHWPYLECNLFHLFSRHYIRSNFESDKMYNLPIDFYTDEWNCTTAMIYALWMVEECCENIIKGRANVHALMCATTSMLRWCYVVVLCCVVCLPFKSNDIASWINYCIIVLEFSIWFCVFVGAFVGWLACILFSLYIQRSKSIISNHFSLAAVVVSSFISLYLPAYRFCSLVWRCLSVHFFRLSLYGHITIELNVFLFLQ